MAIKALQFGKETNLVAIVVQQADGIMRVYGRHQAVSGITDGPKMTGSDVAGSTGERKIYHTALITSSGMA